MTTPCGRDAVPGDRIDDERILVGAEVHSQHVQLFAVRDDAPVNRDIVREHAELDEATEFADHLEPLDHRVGMAGRLDVNIAAVAARCSCP